MTPSARSPRLVVESGTHLADNLGDLAMLQVALLRLREAWPDAVVGVLTAAPERLARHCPDAEPLPAQGRWRWLSPPAGPEPGPAARPARLLAAAGWRRGGRTGRAALWADKVAHRADGSVTRLIAALLDADGFLLAGRGGTTDVFLGDSLQTLELVRAAIATGRPTAALGQGIGPLTDPVLARTAGDVLGRVDVLSVREGRVAPGHLAAIGAGPARAVVTGDDAVELALPSDGAPARGDSIGLSVRRAAYAGLAPEQLARAGEVIASTARRLGARLTAVPISIGEQDPDAPVIRAVAGATPLDGGEDVRAVPEAVARAARCRIVVTGTYHAAVFALAQGVPVVGLHGSDYYADKLAGLGERFGGGVRLVGAGDGLDRRLEQAMEDAWHAPAGERESLVAAGCEQVRAGRAAYRRFTELVELGMR